MKKDFKYAGGKLSLPVFFPDATRAVLRSLDSEDIEKTKIPGVLVNTYHLWRELDKEVIKKFGGIGKFMDWKGSIICDSGGFQVMSMIKSGEAKGKITDEGIIIYPAKDKRIVLTPEKSIRFQMSLKTDLVVVLDDFTDPKVGYKEAKESVERTIKWAIRSKKEFEEICQEEGLNGSQKPYLLGVVQGGKYQDLRKECTKRLVKIGFDGLGYGGWPIDEKGKFDLVTPKTIVENSPKDYFFFGLGVGKPEDIVACSKLGFNIFDCVLPTRDARHSRLYVYNAPSIDKIDVRKKNFYSFYKPDKEKYLKDTSPISTACDCLTCKRYSKAYLAHLFKIKEVTALRLATIHNLRFYSLLMEKIKENQ